MPSIRCVSCQNMFRIPTGKWKLILDDEPYVCSAECLLKWIRAGDRLWYSPLKVGTYAPKDIGDRWGFRSNFERRFAEFLFQNHIAFGFEEWTFPVGTTVYIPDFSVPEFNCFIETKGLWRLGQKKKFKKFRALYPSIPIIVVPWILQGEFK